MIEIQEYIVKKNGCDLVGLLLFNQRGILLVELWHLAKTAKTVIHILTMMIGSPRQNIEQPLWGGSNCSSPWSCFIIIISRIIMFYQKIWPSLSALIWTCITFSNCSSSATTMMFARELLATNPTWCHRDHADRKSDFYGTSISPLPGCLWCKYQWRAPRPPSRQCGIWT